MFKGFKLRQMAVVANQVISDNMDAFKNYGTKVDVKTETNHIQVKRNNDVEYFMPASWTGSSQYAYIGYNKLMHMRTATFCMNTTYKVAKALKKDPVFFVAEVIEKFCEDVRNGNCPTENFCVPNTAKYVDKKKAI